MTITVDLYQASPYKNMISFKMRLLLYQIKIGKSIHASSSSLKEMFFSNAIVSGVILTTTDYLGIVDQIFTSL